MVVKASIATCAEPAKGVGYGASSGGSSAAVGAESRTGMEKIGRRLLKLLPVLSRRLTVRRLRRLEAAYALGASACLRLRLLWLGIPLEQAAEGYLYACVVTCVNSALRLMSIGQTEGAGYRALCPENRAAWSAAAEHGAGGRLYGMPMAELAMIRHETLYSRLFMSIDRPTVVMEE